MRSNRQPQHRHCDHEGRCFARASRNDRLRSQRSGAALIVVLVVLGIVSAICANLLKMSITERHQARREALAAQANWLAESGVDLAKALLTKDADSKEFAWKIPAEQLDGHHEALVRIRIAPVENQPKRKQVTVTAEYPSNRGQPIRPRLVRFVDL